MDYSPPVGGIRPWRPNDIQFSIKKGWWCDWDSEKNKWYYYVPICTWTLDTSTEKWKPWFSIEWRYYNSQMGQWIPTERSFFFASVGGAFDTVVSEEVFFDELFGTYKVKSILSGPMMMYEAEKTEIYSSRESKIPLKIEIHYEDPELGIFAFWEVYYHMNGDIVSEFRINC